MSANEFQSYLYDSFEVDNNHPRFSCIITYESKSGVVRDNTSAYFLTGTMDYGKIRLVETDKLSSKNFHLDFDPNYQSYRMYGDSLEISGSSPKMGGAYKVTVTPTAAL